MKLLISNRLLKIRFSTLQAISEDLKHQGFSIERNRLTEAQCAKLRVYIDEMISSGNFSWTDGSDYRIFEAEKLIDKDLLENAFDNADQIAKVFHGSTNCYTDLIAKIVFKKNNLGSGGGWHRDSPYPQFKSIIYLSDATEATGAFEIVPYSQRFLSAVVTSLRLRKPLKNKRFSEQEIDELADNAVTLTGTAGDQLLVNTNCIHRGRPLSERDRFAITRYYFSSESERELFLANL